MGMLTTHSVFSKFLQGGPLAIPESGMLLGGRRIVGGDPTDGQVIRWNPDLERFEPQTLLAADLAVHVLADISGLGASHTVSGLTTRQVLIATGVTTALFRALQDADIPATHAGSAHHAKYTDAEAIAAVKREIHITLAHSISGVAFSS